MKHTFSKTTFFTLLFAVFMSAANAQPAKAPKQISGGVLNGKALSLPKPEYPADARAAKLSGTVKVQVLIDETGKIISANAISGLENVSLRLAAESAALKATFSPTTLAGQPVKVSGVIVYNFVAEKTNEEKLKLMALSMMLRMARGFAADLDKMNQAMESKNIFAEAASDFPEFPNEFAALTSLDKLPADKRVEAIDKASSSIRSKLAGSNKWQFELGEEFGELMTPLMLLVESGAEGGDTSTLDESAFKLSLNKLRDLTYSAPPDFPKDVLEKLKVVVAIGEKEDLFAPDNLKEFAKKLMALIQTISPD